MPMDQATGLRNLVDTLRSAADVSQLEPWCSYARRTSGVGLAPLSQPVYERGRSVRSTRTIAVTSGKGGVGKTNLTVNLAIVLSRMGQRVLILDGDLGLANVDVVLGVHSRYSMQHVLNGAKTIDEIVVEGPESVKIVPGGSGLYDMANLDDDRAQALMESIAALDGTADVLLIDTAAGISDNVVNLVLGAGEVLVVASPEPTAITDAYGLIKVTAGESRQARFKLVVNLADSAVEAEGAAQRITSAADRFLNVEVDYCGFIFADPNVAKAVMQQIPFVVAYPRSPASVCINSLGRRLLGQPTEHGDGLSISQFFRNVVRR